MTIINYKYSHIGILKNRSLLTVNPFNPLKNKVIEIIDKEIIKYNKKDELNIEIEDYISKCNLNEKDLLDIKKTIGKAKYLSKNNSVNEITEMIRSIKKVLYKIFKEKEIKEIKLKEYTLNLEKTKIEADNKNIKHLLFIYISSSTINLINEIYINKEDLTLIKTKEHLEKIKKLKTALNQVKLSERYYENANNMKDENLKLNLYYYFKLNFVKAYSCIQYYETVYVNKKYNTFFQFSLEEIFKKYKENINNHTNPQKKENEKKLLFLKTIPFMNIEKVLDFENVGHGISYKEKTETSPRIELLGLKGQSIIKKINELKNSAWFHFYITESEYNEFEYVEELFSHNKIEIDELILNIIEFKSLNYLFNAEKYNEDFELLSLGDATKTIFFSSGNEHICFNIDFIMSKTKLKKEDFIKKFNNKYKLKNINISNENTITYNWVLSFILLYPIIKMNRN